MGLVEEYRVPRVSPELWRVQKECFPMWLKTITGIHVENDEKGVEIHTESRDFSGTARNFWITAVIIDSFPQTKGERRHTAS